MIITRTPFRVSFTGGGSDLKEFYSKNGYGAVINAAIDKYMYIVIHPYFHDKIRIKYSKTEDAENAVDVKHPIVRECLKKVNIEKGVEIASFADVPAGTGLGSSSSFTVGLLNALYAYKGQDVSRERLAREACEIEIDILGEPIGKQDQYAAAYGGINYIKFHKGGNVEVMPISLTEDQIKQLQKSLCLYHVGGSRKASDILSEQKKNMSIEDKILMLRKMVDMTDTLKDDLIGGKMDVIGGVLHEGWSYKKGLASGISNEAIDEIYDKVLKNGANGGKLLGAGGTGFLLVHSNDHSTLNKFLKYKSLPFAIDREGAKVIFKD
ncbi:GHMP kinase [Candidatus Omnitrophota bacterium]